MISLLSQGRYDRDAIKEALSPVFAAHGLTGRLTDRAARRVLLKPNFVIPASDASVTHPDFYMAIAEWLQARGYEVGIGESPAFGTCKAALRLHGVYDECLAKGISVVTFSRSQACAGVDGDNAYAKLTIARELHDWDAVINLPKLKTHRQFMFTGATKNLYGCVAGKRKFYRHNICANDPVRFARMVIKNAEQADCVLHVADGIDAMHVTGPRGGRDYPLGKIIVADDCLALDWLFCQLIKLDAAITPLFRALDAERLRTIANTCRTIQLSDDFEPCDDFVHARLIHISFSPWHITRSLWRMLSHKYAHAID